MTRPQVASRSEVARGLRASVCAATPRRGSLLYSITECFRRGGVETRNYASVFALAAVLTAAAFAPLQSLAGSATLKCSGYTGTETLTDFQALIKLDEGRYGFSYADCADQAAGTDVWFSSDAAGNNVLEREIDTWNPDGSSYIWVKIPSLAAGTEITMHWGDAAKAQPAANTAVWTGYAGVWHMGKASGAETEPDATGHGLEATASASSFSSSVGDTSLMVAVTDGVAGGSRVNTTANTIGNALKVPSYKNQLDNYNTFTVGGWFCQTLRHPGRNRILCSRAAKASGTNATAYYGWELTSPYQEAETPSGVDQGVYADCYVARVSAGNTSKFNTFKPTKVVESVVNRWVHYSVVFDGTSVKAYVDGELATDGTITDALPTNDNGFWIGRYGNRGNPFIGRYDEIRMYNGAMSADRVKADYDTVKTPTMFFSLSEPKSVTLQCTGYTGSETLANFQALIKLDEGRYGFSYAECADLTAGTDVWFSSDPEGNNVLAREIDTWNPDGSSYIWVKIPSLAAGTEITMHWGDASKAQPAANTAVWTGFAGVWHMGKASGAETEPDATGHELHATPHASSFSGWDGDTDLMIAEADGLTGGCRTNTVEETKANALKVPDYKNQLDDFNTFTIGGWFFQTVSHGSNSGGNRIFCSRPAKAGSGGAAYYNGWEVTTGEYTGTTDAAIANRDTKVLRVTSGKTATKAFNATTTVERVVGRWVHYCVSFSRNSSGDGPFKAYADGVLVNEGTIPSANLFTYEAGKGFWIGRFGDRANPFVGKYDEIRMYNGAMSADRVKADYDTMNAPTEFFTNPDRVATAEWTGQAGNGSVADSGNWLCKGVAGNVIEDALPTADTDVTISGGAVVMQAPSGTSLQYATLAINCTLGADCDWRGLGSVEISGTITLGGHTLTLADTKGSGTITGEGKLVVDVAEGNTVTNGSLALSGALQLEKTGEGTFTASKTSQTYTGGTTVSGGTFIPGANGTSRTTGASGSQITVGSGGVFNLNGRNAFQDYRFVLDGGALKNDADIASVHEVVGIASITLVADSSIILDKHIGLYNASKAQVNLDLGGHTLTLHGGAALYMTNVKATQGRIVLAGETYASGTGGTRINCHTSPASDLSAAELVMNGHSAVYVLASPFKVGAYECNSTSQVSNDGYKGQMHVYGRFAPNTDRFYGATLQNGATLDLSARTGCFDTNGSGHILDAYCSLGFASGAAITVNLAGRTDLGAIAKSDLPLVVQWATEPNATFTLDPETAKRFKLVKCAIETTDGETTTTVRGLRLRYKPGLIITVW